MLATGCKTATNPNDIALLEHERGWRLLASRPVVYSKAAPSVSFAARDYLALVPLEQHTNGRWAANLWVGVASTVDPALRYQEVAPTHLTLTIDGDEVSMPLQPWQGEVKQPVPLALPVSLALQTVVDKQLLARLALAKDVTMTLTSTDTKSRAYAHWRGRWPLADQRALGKPVDIAAKAHQPPIIQ